MVIKLDFDLVGEIKKTILKSKNIGKYYTNIYPNTKYTLTSLLEDMTSYLKSGASLRNSKLITSYRSMHFHLNRFRENNIFKKTYQRIINNNKLFEKTKILLTDTSFINNEIGTEKLGRNKFNKNKKSYKVSFLSDENAIPLDILIEPGNVSDIVILKKHIQRVKPKLNKKILLADAGYCSNNIRNELIENGCLPLISYNNRGAKEENKRKFTSKEVTLYKNRIKIEHSFCLYKKYKNVKTINVKYYNSYSNLLYLTLLNIINK